MLNLIWKELNIDDCVGIKSNCDESRLKNFTPLLSTVGFQIGLGPALLTGGGKRLNRTHARLKTRLLLSLLSKFTTPMRTALLSYIGCYNGL